MIFSMLTLVNLGGDRLAQSLGTNKIHTMLTYPFLWLGVVISMFVSFFLLGRAGRKGNNNNNNITITSFKSFLCVVLLLVLLVMSVVVYWPSYLNRTSNNATEHASNTLPIQTGARVEIRRSGEGWAAGLITVPCTQRGGPSVVHDFDVCASYAYTAIIRTAFRA